MVDISAVETIIREVADEHILPLFRNLGRDDVSTKSGPNDLVTIADVNAENALAPRLMDLLPGSVVLGEEGTAKDPSVLDALAGDAPVWVIDPIDGTRNFVNGSAEFATMVALAEKGETRAAWIYPPIDGACATAEKGSGSFWRGEPMAGREGTELGAMQGTYHKNYIPKDWARRIEPNLKRLGKTGPAHCAAYVYLRLSSGEHDFGVHGKLMPWDHLAGTLMLREAGGEAGFLDANERYAAQVYPERPMLTVSDGARFDVLKQTLVDG